ncbi:uncharacterized protein BCR38DRAFT_310444, partial [Pseudomassariella vexata]
SFLCLAAVARSHLLITYPGSKGYNLAVNGSVVDTNGLSIGTDPDTDDPIYPYGEQWLFPCGGLPVSQNRTTWPVTGNGALSFQPGLQAGHSTAMLSINLGLGTIPINYSLPMVPIFSITGPTNEQYFDALCLPSVPFPSGVSPRPGDNATIQIVEADKNGAALYSCVDVTFVEAGEVTAPGDGTCANSSSISFHTVST